MKHFVDATRRAVQQGNWYAALALALTMPDICGRINYPGKKSEERVRLFFDQYLAQNYRCGPSWAPIISMTGGDFYALRCAYLHQGEFELQGQRARDVLSRIHPTEPGPTVRHNNLNAGNSNLATGVKDGILQLSIDMFCEEVCIAVEAWLAAVSSDDRIKGEIETLGKIGENGTWG